MTDYEIAIAAAKDAREQAERSTDPAKRASWEEIAITWSREADRLAPTPPGYASVETMPDGSQPVRLSFQIKVF